MALDIGQKVKVIRVRDRVSGSVAKRLGQEGTITQFKMVDGSGVGVVVEFSDQFASWFFEDELKATV
ncbi:MAG: cytochrome b6f subunit family protein [Cyanobacteria bacterium P01_D01_bin.156]